MAAEHKKKLLIVFKLFIAQLSLQHFSPIHGFLSLDCRHRHQSKLEHTRTQKKLRFMLCFFSLFNEMSEIELHEIESSENSWTTQTFFVWGEHITVRKTRTRIVSILPRNIIILCTAQILIYFMQSLSPSLAPSVANLNLLFKMWLQIVGYSSKIYSIEIEWENSLPRAKMKKKEKPNETERLTRHIMALCIHTHTHHTHYMLTMFGQFYGIAWSNFKITMLAWFVEIFTSSSPPPHSYVCKVKIY